LNNGLGARRSFVRQKFQFEAGLARKNAQARCGRTLSRSPPA